MGFVLASLMGTVASISKLYLSGETATMFWMGTVGIVLRSVRFLLLMKHLHKKINDLEKL